MTRHIPGLTARAATDLPVLLAAPRPQHTPRTLNFSYWLASIPPWAPFLLFIVLSLWPYYAFAQTNGDARPSALEALWRWIPFLITRGFLFTVLISVLTMIVGTILGVFLGLGQISPNRIIRGASYWITQIFRNSPWLVLLFIVMLSFPFQIELFGYRIPIPDWTKAVFGLSLPVMANISEIVRGAIGSVPSAQWEAAESLAFTRRQTLYQIILPQCIKRMIPPWMNWYAILTMATPIVSILGVEEVLNLTRQAIEAENNRPELLVPFYGFVLLIFFAYCYPIARLTVWLERKYALKL
ncbi:amino acid ABC transporter permease [Ruegeria sp. Ofav3-42]|uniref:amino acid ABC transporter permease n=1 Tax=Ruegeria sp. Ofav3-42 TaxID=2917759 RepID=UPI001EF5E9D0|nr:amino acid ABC transporter permease [Ruegeria sp. Ofav3-42]MCG7522534.1 amino acid ABC transporter permease [Ruegeria sp. Ofav3-42]